MLDPSFTRADFLFIEGKSKAKLTFGTMKPGAWAYVDLDMEPRRQMSIILTTVKATYNTPEEISEITELFTAGEKISFKSAKEYFIKNIEFYKLLIGVIVLGILPIMYSQRLRTQRMKLYKSS